MTFKAALRTALGAVMLSAKHITVLAHPQDLPLIAAGAEETLAARGARVPESLLQRDVTQPIVENEALQDELVRLYNAQPDTAGLLELLTDIDEGFQEWRYRHVKMVERTIGNKHGTGGSLGAEFLKRTLFIPLFPDLWAIRHRF